MITAIAAHHSHLTGHSSSIPAITFLALILGALTLAALTLGNRNP